MLYVIGFLAVVFVAVGAWKIITSKSSPDLTTNTNTGKIRPDKPGPWNDI